MYLTSDRELAKVWAGQWCNTVGQVGYGWLYRISADEDVLEPDDDLLSLPGLSFQAPRARVDSVYAKAVSPNQPGFARTLQRVLRDLESAKRRP